MGLCAISNTTSLKTLFFMTMSSSYFGTRETTSASSFVVIGFMFLGILLMTWFARILQEFRSQHPNVDEDPVLSDRSSIDGGQQIQIQISKPDLSCQKVSL